MPESLTFEEEALTLAVRRRSELEGHQVFVAAVAVDLVARLEEGDDLEVVFDESLRPLSHPGLNVPGEDAAFDVASDQVLPIEQHGGDAALVTSDDVQGGPWRIALPNVDVRVVAVRE